ncbi:MAG: D-2-hydroxyacid dehydrogenase [Anaerolineae bacterium]|jgi:phosphoglycerate dehydrogenase-like enzyme
MESVEVLCTLRFSDDLLEQLRAVSPRLRLTQQTCHDDEEVARALADHPAVRVLYSYYVPGDALQRAPHLDWIQLHSAGLDHILGSPLMDSDVALTTTSGIHATPIAEYVLASMLAHRWRVPHWTHCQREGKWPAGRWDLYARPELRGSTLGIVGYGSIGREVGRLAQALAMRVLALSRGGERREAGYSVEGTGDPQGTVPEAFYTPDRLHEMLARCDYVVVATPLTPETRGLLDEAALRAMKPTAYLVNIARGGIVDEAALVRALQEGWIDGAGLDVFEEEPLPADSPLWELENALLSPHVAGFTPRYDERAAALFARNLARYLAGEPLLNLVDKSQRY